MNGARVFWLYELHEGNGIFQGCTGPGAEGIVRRVAETIAKEPMERPGKPFMAYVFEGHPNAVEIYEAEVQAVQHAGFNDVHELLSAYRLLVLQSEATSATLAAADLLLKEAASAGVIEPSLRERIEHFVEGRQ